MKIDSKLLSFHKKTNNNNIYYNIKYLGDILYLNLENCVLTNIIKQGLSNIYYLKLSKLEYLNSIKDIENYIISYIKDNSSGLFSIDIVSNNIHNLFFSNIVKKNNDFLLIIQDYNNNKLDINKKYTVKVILNGIWFRNDTFGINYLTDHIYE